MFAEDRPLITLRMISMQNEQYRIKALSMSNSLEQMLGINKKESQKGSQHMISFESKSYSFLQIPIINAIYKS